MKLCFDATRFGTGLDGAVSLAAKRGVKLVEFSFAPFTASPKAAKGLDKAEKDYFNQIAETAAENDVSFACLSVNYCLVPEDKRSFKQFMQMLTKVSQVAEAVNCKQVGFSIMPGVDQAWKASIESQYPAIQEVMGNHGVKPLLRLSTPHDYRDQSLKGWRAMDPLDWRDLLSICEGLSLSFSPADCVWLGIDYLRILSGIASAIEHIEAHDIEINRDLMIDSGLFGPLWWRYRVPGKGQVDWSQLIEALKLYDFKGTFSVHLDDEFVNGDGEELEDALDFSVKKLGPFIRG